MIDFLVVINEALKITKNKLINVIVIYYDSIFLGSVMITYIILNFMYEVGYSVIYTSLFV